MTIEEVLRSQLVRLLDWEDAHTDYWPADPAPPSAETWDEAVAQLQFADHAGD